jgi:hypothetical protein
MKSQTLSAASAPEMSDYPYGKGGIAQRHRKSEGGRYGNEVVASAAEDRVVQCAPREPVIEGASFDVLNANNRVRSRATRALATGRAKVQGDRAGRIGVIDRINAGTAIDIVVARASVQPIVTAVAVKPVITGPAKQGICTAAAIKPVVAAKTKQCVACR